MSERYDHTFAFHYAAYRPPFHTLILEYVLSTKNVFQNGLDIGCGTGYSAIALTKYCSHVYGVEPSESMLKEVNQHKKIIYIQGIGDSLPLSKNSIHLVTFAGSLCYSKSSGLVKELQRVCQEHAVIIPYDFEIVFDDVLKSCGVHLNKSQCDYNYTINFSRDIGFTEIMVGNEQIHVEIPPTQFAHVLLADSTIYDIFVEKYRHPNPFPLLVHDLGCLNEKHDLKVNIYFSKYQIRTNG